jgi:hypothetical protein
MRREVVGSGIRGACYLILIWLFVVAPVPIKRGTVYHVGVLLDIIGLLSLFVFPKLGASLVIPLLIGWATNLSMYVQILVIAASTVVLTAPLPLPEQIMLLFKQLGRSTRYFDDIISRSRNQFPDFFRPLPLAHDTHGIERTGPGVKLMPLVR